jgi:uncharacterized damage-inducible protein DinB
MMEKIFVDSLVKIFERDLHKLEEEIKKYTNESTLWKIEGDIKNAAGNLCLHLCGNLQHYIGHILGHIAYQRNRDNEFSAKDISKDRLIAEIQKTRHSVTSTLKSLDTRSLSNEYPDKVFDHTMTTTYFLIHLASHLNYHLGQVNYHRRLLEK